MADTKEGVGIFLCQLAPQPSEDGRQSRSGPWCNSLGV